MTATNLADEVRATIAVALGIQPHEVTSEMPIEECLADSLTRFEVVCLVEDHLGRALPLALWASLRTFADLVEWVATLPADMTTTSTP